MQPPSGTLTVTIDATRADLRHDQIAVPDDVSSLPAVLPRFLERQLIAQARRAGCMCEPAPQVVTRVLEDPAWGRYLAPLRVHAAACPALAGSGPRVTIAVVEEEP